MNDDDTVLLRRYADEGSEVAFTEVVRRHVDLVYGAALRRTGGDPHRAADVAQQVFVTLARNARKLSRHAVLGAWLHTATRNAALNLMISEQRRKTRELKAVTLDPAFATSVASPDWDQLRPAFAELSQRLVPAMTRAQKAYRMANNGDDPPSPQALLPYFATPQEGADFVELLETQKKMQAK